MLLRVHRPAPPLDRFVELITYYEGYAPKHTMERVLPDGGVEIIVDLTPFPKRLYERSDLSRSRAFRNAWISGMRREWIVIEAARDSSMAVIRFRPGGAYPFLGFPVCELTDVVTQLEDVLGEARAASLRDRILERATPAARLAAIETFLLELAGPRLEPHPAVEFLVERLADPGRLKIAELTARVGYSQKHVVALFQRWVGMAPKAYCRMRKLQTAVGLVHGQPRGAVDWADVAHLAGFYDQAHLGNEFRRQTGLTPSAYLESDYEYLNFIPLDPR